MRLKTELTAQQITSIHAGKNVELGQLSLSEIDTSSKVKALDVFVNEQMEEYLATKRNSLGISVLKRWFTAIRGDTQAEAFYLLRINYKMHQRGISKEEMFVQRSFWLFEFDHPVRAQCRNIVAHPVCATLSFPRC